MRLFVVVALLCSAWAGLGWTQTLRVVGFNVESGGACPDVVHDLIAAAQDVDLWGFSEVQDAIWATMFAHQLRRRRPRPGYKWHLDEVFLTINGAPVSLARR